MLLNNKDIIMPWILLARDLINLCIFHGHVDNLCFEKITFLSSVRDGQFMRF